MSDLSRNLLASAREGLTPDAATMARVRAKVATSVATAPAAASPMLVKLGAVVLAIGITATVLATRGDRTPQVPRWSVAPMQLEEPRGVDRAAVHVAPAPPQSAPTLVPTTKAASRAVPAPAVDEPPSPEPATLSREVELIDLAMVSLRKGAARTALDAIRVFERETFGHGQMAEEAAAIEIEAHCRLGDDVTELLARFDRNWPSSAQRERIQTTCFGL